MYEKRSPYIQISDVFCYKPIPIMKPHIYHVLNFLIVSIIFMETSSLYIVYTLIYFCLFFLLEQ
jgi:hypothetical protein